VKEEFVNEDARFEEAFDEDLDLDLDLEEALDEDDEDCVHAPGSPTGRQGFDLMAAKSARQASSVSFGDFKPSRPPLYIPSQVHVEPINTGTSPPPLPATLRYQGTMIQNEEREDVMRPRVDRDQAQAQDQDQEEREDVMRPRVPKLNLVGLAKGRGRQSSGKKSPGRVSPSRKSPSGLSTGRVSPGRKSPSGLSTGRVSPGRVTWQEPPLPLPLDAHRAPTSKLVVPSIKSRELDANLDLDLDLEETGAPRSSGDAALGSVSMSSLEKPTAGLGLLDQALKSPIHRVPSVVDGFDTLSPVERVKAFVGYEEVEEEVKDEDISSALGPRPLSSEITSS